MFSYFCHACSDSIFYSCPCLGFLEIVSFTVIAIYINTAVVRGVGAVAVLVGVIVVTVTMN